MTMIKRRPRKRTTEFEKLMNKIFQVPDAGQFLERL
jgi:hypothetical protein